MVVPTSTKPQTHQNGAARWIKDPNNGLLSFGLFSRYVSFLGNAKGFPGVLGVFQGVLKNFLITG